VIATVRTAQSTFAPIDKETSTDSISALYANRRRANAPTQEYASIETSDFYYFFDFSGQFSSKKNLP
jgi:hypothetical protein